MEEDYKMVSDNKNTFPVKLAHGYFPIQQLNEVCISIKCLDCGTIFPELNMPYGTDPEYVFDE